ncbi:MAG: hypothetical protein ACKO86_23550, partial [Dolichospermum sp.]
IEDKKEDTFVVSITSQQSAITAIQDPTSNGKNNHVPPEDNLNYNWYLGIDVGTTGISAALLNQSKLVVYPIYWSAENPNSNADFQQSFRLPAEVYLPTNAPTNQEKSEELSSSQSSVPYHLYSAQLKPYLQIAVPYQQEHQKWEPMLQLNEFSPGPLIWIIRLVFVVVYVCVSYLVGHIIWFLGLHGLVHRLTFTIISSMVFCMRFCCI